MTLAVLSWGSHKTLIQSLESYRRYGLDSLERDRLIFFQEISVEDIDIANKYGYEPLGTETNVGIAEAYKYLVTSASEDTFLFLENDWELIEMPDYIHDEALSLLDHCDFDVIRLRHRKNHGWPLWSKSFAGNEMDHPTHLLDSIHWSEEPIGPINWDYHGWWSTTSAFANWTNNPTMFRTQWLKDNILPRMTGDIEVDLQPWWEQQTFSVAQSTTGLFTHNRIDR